MEKCKISIIFKNVTSGNKICLLGGSPTTVNYTLPKIWCVNQIQIQNRGKYSLGLAGCYLNGQVDAINVSHDAFPK